MATAGVGARTAAGALAALAARVFSLLPASLSGSMSEAEPCAAEPCAAEPAGAVLQEREPDATDLTEAFLQERELDAISAMLGDFV